MHNNVRSNVIINLIRTITMTILSFVTFPYVCRVLGDSAFGLYSWAVSFVYYFLVIARISIPNIAVREIVKVKDNPDELSRKTHEFFIIQAITTLISFALLCVFLFSIPTFDDKLTKSIILILSLNFLIGIFSFEWIYTAFEKHTYMAFRSIVIATIVDILIFSLIKHPDHVVLYTFFCVLTTILTVVSNLVFLPQIIKLKKPANINLKQYIPTISIMFAISLAAAIYDKTDTFILGILDQTKAAVGSYAVGMKGVEIVIGIITALSTVFIPRATAYYNANDERQFKNINIYATNICLFIVVPAVVLMICLSKPLTELIGGTQGYINSNIVLISLASLMLTFSINSIIYTQILIPTKKEKLYLYVLASAVLLNIGLSIILGRFIFSKNPAFGVALGTSITDLLMLVVMILLTWKNSRSIILRLNNIKILILGLLLVPVTIILNKYIRISNTNVEEAQIFKLLIIGSIDFVVYIIGSIICKEKLVRSFIKKA